MLLHLPLEQMRYVVLISAMPYGFDLANANLPGVTAVPVEARALPRVLRLAQQEEVST